MGEAVGNAKQRGATLAGVFDVYLLRGDWKRYLSCSEQPSIGPTGQ